MWRYIKPLKMLVLWILAGVLFCKAAPTGNELVGAEMAAFPSLGSLPSLESLLRFYNEDPPPPPPVTWPEPQSQPQSQLSDWDADSLQMLRQVLAEQPDPNSAPQNTRQPAPPFYQQQQTAPQFQQAQHPSAASFHSEETHLQSGARSRYQGQHYSQPHVQPAMYPPSIPFYRISEEDFTSPVPGVFYHDGFWIVQDGPQYHSFEVAHEGFYSAKRSAETLSMSLNHHASTSSEPASHTSESHQESQLRNMIHPSGFHEQNSEKERESDCFGVYFDSRKNAWVACRIFSGWDRRCFTFNVRDHGFGNAKVLAEERWRAMEDEVVIDDDDMISQIEGVAFDNGVWKAAGYKPKNMRSIKVFNVKECGFFEARLMAEEARNKMDRLGFKKPRKKDIKYYEWESRPQATRSPSDSPEKLPPKAQRKSIYSGIKFTSPDWRVDVCGLNGEKIFRTFSIKKYGYKLAKTLAEEFVGELIRRNIVSSSIRRGI